MALQQYNGRFCITGTELIITEDNPDGFVSKPMYDYLRRQNPNMVARRANGVLSSLIFVDELTSKYQAMVNKRYPNPKAQKEAKSFMDKIENDPDAVTFFQDYELSDGSSLPQSAQAEYVNNAKVLNMFPVALAEHRVARNNKISKKFFWEMMSQNLKRFMDECPHTLPENPRRLREKFEEYNRVGYKCLVPNRYLNQNTTKITDDVADWLIARYASNIDRVTVTQLWCEYNKIAADRGWKPLKSDRSIRLFLYREEIQPKWYGSRHGSTKAKEKFSRQHRTLLPTMRDSLWYSDGTKLNYFYQNEDGKLSTISVYEVVDVYSEVLLGYHISKTEDFDAQWHAYKMALQTAGHKPYEIVYDNQGGHKKNKEFFATLSRISRATAPYNGKSKTIENIFKRFQESYLHRDPCFTGQNITTQKLESDVNAEWILANKANMPTLEEVTQIYRNRRNEWNNAPHPATGRPRMEMYRASFNPNSRAIDMLDMVNIFWLTNDKPVTYRASGLQLKVKGITYAYEVLTDDSQPDDAFRLSNVGKKFIVKYDLDDMDVVALYEETANGLRFKTYGRTYLTVHRAKQEQEDGEQSFIKAREIADKAERMRLKEENDTRLERHGLLPEQHGYTTPKVRGVSRKEQDRFDLGTYTKAVSNAIPEELAKEADEALSYIDIY